MVEAQCTVRYNTLALPENIRQHEVYLADPSLGSGVQFLAQNVWLGFAPLVLRSCFRSLLLLAVIHNFSQNSILIGLLWLVRARIGETSTTSGARDGLGSTTVGSFMIIVRLSDV